MLYWWQLWSYADLAAGREETIPSGKKARYTFVQKKFIVKNSTK